MIVLVTGDRAWTDGAFIAQVLDHHNEVEDINGVLDPITLLFEGCATGADRWSGDHEWYDERTHDMAYGWAREARVETRHFPAPWGAMKKVRGSVGNPAGAIRNRDMLKAAQLAGLDLVLAFHDDFPHSRGTRDMVKIARDAQVPVELHSHANVIRFDPALTLPLDL